MVTSQVSLDITRRSDAAKKSTKRAENKLQFELNKAGGLEDEMRYQLSELKREQSLLRKELQTLKFESRMSSRSSLNGGSWDRSSNGFPSLRSPEDFSRRISADYGKNFFGYISEPGTKKIIKTPRRQIERSIDVYCKKIDELIHQENISHKLKEQQKENCLVDDKLKKWKSNNPPLRKKSYFLPQSQFLNKETKDQRLKRNKSESEAESVKATENKRKSAGSVQSLPLIDANQLHSQVPINDHIAHSTHGSAKSQRTLPPKTTSSDMIFDAELYAPDGRIRMAHRMPEFHAAFNEARRTRYVRTKEKRSFERNLSVNQIFE